MHYVQNMTSKPYVAIDDTEVRNIPVYTISDFFFTW